jgi:hypothetical protein
MVGAAFLALLAGYVAGSYHPMNQLYSRFMEASRTVIDNYRLPPGGLLGDALEVTDSDESPTDLRDRIRLASSGFDEESLLEIGDEYATEGFSVTLTEARFARPDGPPSEGQSTPPKGATALICTLLITNTADETVLPIGRPESFDRRTFSLRDSSEQRLRDVEFAIHEVGDALSSSREIAPGEQRTYVATFTIPRPMAEPLILSINLEALGGMGRVRFDIPAPESKESPPEDS